MATNWVGKLRINVLLKLMMYVFVIILTGFKQLITTKPILYFPRHAGFKMCPVTVANV